MDQEAKTEEQKEEEELEGEPKPAAPDAKPAEIVEHVPERGEPAWQVEIAKVRDELRAGLEAHTQKTEKVLSRLSEQVESILTPPEPPKPPSLKDEPPSPPAKRPLLTRSSRSRARRST
jgi:hypothetical protein